MSDIHELILAKLEHLDEMLNRRFDSLERRFDRLEARLEGLGLGNDDIRALLGEIRSGIDRIDLRLGLRTAEAEEIEEAMAEAPPSRFRH